MNEEGRKQLWIEYSKHKASVVREKIIIEYAGLVKIVAGRLSMYLGYTVEYDDLIGYGTFGLIDAIDKFDHDKGVKFETYASLRIRGAILDQIRKMDWIPRTLRQKQKKIEAANSRIETLTGRAATDEEIASELEISIKELENWKNQTKVSNLISLDEFLEQGSEVNVDTRVSSHYDQPEQVIAKQELKVLLEKVLESLTENERKVIVLYYYEELTLKEISYILEVSESRVSQLHTKALQKLKMKLGNKEDLLAIF
ncbi:RNA polymerase sigma factor for flagellar operon [Lachnospiraceae bacterium KM106-2]|nr:RNA polymerase sigma factor for flagellar operon [Lachnospiraceae bacterium KM106-2]